jgi:hypothetical protein
MNRGEVWTAPGSRPHDGVAGENAMLIDESFHTAYRELEERMKALAKTDGAVFLPTPEPLERYPG